MSNNLSCEELNKIQEVVNDGVTRTQHEVPVIASLFGLLYNICNDIMQYLYFYSAKNYDMNIRSLNKSNIPFNIELIQKFYKENNISFDIEKYIREGNITIENIKPKDITLNSIMCGKSLYSDGKNKIEIQNNSLVADSATWIHELSHFRDQPDHERNEISHLFTESIAYTEELIYLDYLEKKGYKKEAKLIKNLIFTSAYNYATLATSIFKVCNLLDSTGALTEENYRLYYADMNYYEHLSRIDYSIKNDFFEIFRASISMMGYYLSLYMYENHKEDHKFMESIQELHDDINKYDMDKCLEHIDLKHIEGYDRLKVVHAISCVNNEMIQKNKVRKI